jgi:hypothetical protein
LYFIFICAPFTYSPYYKSPVFMHSKRKREIRSLTLFIFNNICTFLWKWYICHTLYLLWFIMSCIKRLSIHKWLCMLCFFVTTGFDVKIREDTLRFFVMRLISRFVTWKCSLSCIVINFDTYIRSHTPSNIWPVHFP